MPANVVRRRSALAIEVKGLLASLQDLSRTQSAGSYLYAGTRTDQEPFSFTESEFTGSTLQVEYLGSAGNSRAYIGDAISIDTFLAGDYIFGKPNRGETLIHGNTGAKIGYGTDTLVGRATLQVKHSITTYVGASGIAAGASSAENDTLINPQGTKTLFVQDTSGTGDSGTITLNNGEPIAWTRSDTDLKVVGNDGNELYVDMSAVTPGFDGAVDFESGGTRQ